MAAWRLKETELDLLTQGIVGGAVALSVANKTSAHHAVAIGFAAGLLADTDILIHSDTDPLLNIELHRHFTHALIFIPVGALIATLLIWPILRHRLRFGQIYLYAVAGYATSGLLDACTSYGTHLLWPFSDTRVAWSIISIVDPVFTLLLIAAIVSGWRQRSPAPARIGLLCASIYLLLGWWQHQAALDTAQALAAQRGHTPTRLLVKPTLANLLLWRSVYQHEDRYYVDAIRVGFGSQRVYPGSSIARFSLQREFPELPADSVLARDIARFHRLSDGYIARDTSRAAVLTDIRYSMLPTSLTPMWGIDLHQAAPQQSARFINFRDRPDHLRTQFMAMLLGRDLPSSNGAAAASTD